MYELFMENQIHSPKTVCLVTLDGHFDDTTGIHAGTYG